MKLSEAGELGLLARARVARPDRGDRARRRQLAGGLVVTQDALVEGVHFRFDWLSWRELGWRAAAVNISDLAASAARPEALLVALALPGEIDARGRPRALRGPGRDGRSGCGGDTTCASAGRRRRHRARALRARSGQRRRPARRPDRRHRPARRSRCGVPRGALPPSAAACRRGTPARPRRDPRCWTSRTVLRSMPAISPAARAAGRDRPRPRSARRHRRRRRLRRGLRVARGDVRPARVSRWSAAARRARACSCCAAASPSSWAGTSTSRHRTELAGRCYPRLGPGSATRPAATPRTRARNGRADGHRRPSPSARRSANKITVGSDRTP